MRQSITTSNAPQVIGTYSQAIQTGTTVYISGQIPLDPNTMNLIAGDFTHQLQQVLTNLRSIAIAAGGSLDNIVKINIYLTDLNNFSMVNEIMAQYFSAPYPARAVIGVAALPRGAMVEIDAVLELE